METETGDGDIDCSFGSAGGEGGEGAAAGLKDQGEDVAGDEEPIVELGGKAGVVRAEVDDSAKEENWLGSEDRMRGSKGGMKEGRVIPRSRVCLLLRK